MLAMRAFACCLLASTAALAACGGSVDSAATSDAGGDAITTDTPAGDTPTGDSPTSDTHVTDSTPDATPRIPKQHRPSSNACSPSTGSPPGPCGTSGPPGPPGSCKKDADCKAGTNGHCDIEGGGPLSCGCFYDTCVSDSDCTGGPCACQGTPYQTRSNNCSPGNCKLDADCGASGFCSPSQSTGCSGGLAGYYCHTPSDECVDDTDCATSGGGPKVCTFDATKAHWTCTELLVCA